MTDNHYSSSTGDQEKRRKEICTYQTPWPLYSLACSQRTTPGYLFRFAIGSFIEEYMNKVQIIQLDDERGEFVAKSYFDHPYPTTKIMWAPEPLANSGKDLLATTGDFLRIWCLTEDFETRQEAVLYNNKDTEYCAPVTSFDWNATEPSLLASCSVDTTVTIWDLATAKAKTQLIAHDKEVYDVAWSCGPNLFGTVGADGSLRIFDLRSLEHSSIMYETPRGNPLLKLAWNHLDSNYIATFAADSSVTTILDIRVPSRPVISLPGHVAPVSGVSWAPHSPSHICTVSDDKQALIWDLSTLGVGPRELEDPLLAYTAEEPICSMTWGSSIPDWVTISFGSKIQMLRV